MANTVPIDLGRVAHDLHLPLETIQRTVEMLDDGNTVPFITRYRKDQTGGLDEQQIRQVQEVVARARALAERKQTILKSIESQGKLTSDLAQRIEQAPTAKQLEDLYLPYKPKKQSLATQARERGLEPLAREILEADPKAADLSARAAEFINADRGVHSAAEAILGVGHLLAERFSERADVRGKLRKIIRMTGLLVCSRIESAGDDGDADDADGESSNAADSGDIDASRLESNAAHPVSNDSNAADSENGSSGIAPPVAPTEDAAQVQVDSEGTEPQAAAGALSPPPTAPVESNDESPHESSIDSVGQSADSPTADAPTDAPESVSPESVSSDTVDSTESSPAPDSSVEIAPTAAVASPAVQPTSKSSREAAKQARAAARQAKREKRRQKIEASFKDYFQFQESISKIPHHRVLAINRGERCKTLRVRIEVDHEKMFAAAAETCIPTDHPHADFLHNCLHDALSRLVIPSLEREARRELSDAAETHAVEVFAQNLRKLLLQPPVHLRRVLAMDPGFRSGVKIVALNEFGNVLGHDLIHVVGNEERLTQSRRKLAEIVRQFGIHVVAIGNGTACRETELFVADVIAKELTGNDVAYVIVNEAGASVYSTSELGREELPDHDATQRGAISIGRRLLDPLSELVKITPANIGVGLYQHDIKAKHLQESLDAVVESCVNYVGVDVNAASPALLSYVSGLNQLTARRVYEFRREHGPFRDREQLKEVAGVGDATFVQAAGFLKIIGGDNPLDATSIHPESYSVAQKVLERLGGDLDQFRRIVAGSRPTATAATAGELVAMHAAHTPSSVGPETETEPDAARTEATPLPETTPSSETSPSTASGPPPAIEPPAAADAPAEAAASSTPESTPSDESTTPDDAVPTIADSSAAIHDDQTEPAAPTAEERPPSETDSEATSLVQQAATIDVESLASELDVGKLLLQDIVAALAHPGRDPREDFPPPMFRREVMKFEDLQPGMEMAGTVLNVVDFGAFVDIGLSECGLVHISRLADRYIRDPHEVVGVGDIVKVWVVEVDKARRRVSLTAIAPGTERPREPHGHGHGRGRGRGRRRGDAAPAGQPTSSAPPQGAAGQTGSQQDAGGQAAAGRSQGGRRRGRGGRGGGEGSDRPHGDKPQAGRPRDRKPRHAGDRQRSDKRSDTTSVTARVVKPRTPAPPITQDMVEGKEPMRSFSDLLQFYSKKKDDAPEGPSSEQKS